MSYLEPRVFVPRSFHKTVASSATPEPLGASTLRLEGFTLIAERSASVANTGNVTIQIDGSDAKVLAPGDLWDMPLPSWQAGYFRASDFTVKVAVSGDGVGVLHPPRKSPPGGGIDSEVLNWVSRVRALGGSVSNPTKQAASTFMKAIKAAGLRSKIWRLNLYAGTSGGALENIREVLIKDRPTATDGRDVNNGFINSDYSEATGMAKATNPGAGAFLDTQLSPFNDFGGNTTDLHTAVYCRSNLNESNNSFIGSLNAGVGATSIYLTLRITLAGNNSYGLLIGDAAGSFPQAADANTLGFYQVCRTSSTNCVMYKNGAVFATATGATSGSAVGPTLYIHAEHDSGSGATIATAGTIAGYSIGTGMNATEALAFYNAWQTFQTALGRQV